MPFHLSKQDDPVVETSAIHTKCGCCVHLQQSILWHLMIFLASFWEIYKNRFMRMDEQISGVYPPARHYRRVWSIPSAVWSWTETLFEYHHSVHHGWRIGERFKNRYHKKMAASVPSLMDSRTSIDVYFDVTFERVVVADMPSGILPQVWRTMSHLNTTLYPRPCVTSYYLENWSFWCPTFTADQGFPLISWEPTALELLTSPGAIHYFVFMEDQVVSRHEIVDGVPTGTPSDEGRSTALTLQRWYLDHGLLCGIRITLSEHS